MKEPQQPTDPTVDVRWPRDGVAQVILGGEHDISTADRVNTVLTETLHQCSKLVVDLSHTQFIDSSTIRVLVNAKKRADAVSRQFTLLVATTPIVERTLEITGVLAVLNRVRTLEQALGQD